MNRSPIRCFLFLAFGVAWLLWLPLYFLDRGGAFYTVYFGLSTTAAMWIPAGAYALTRRICGPDVKLAGDLKLHGKGHIRFYLLAWFLPLVLTVLGAAVYFLCFPGELDRSMPYLMQSAGSSVQGIPPIALLLSQIANALTIGPVINAIFAMGEEIGWRGFLYPQLSSRFGRWRGHLLTGLIWGLWHTPINMTGYNYGTQYPLYPWLGIVAMCVFCVALGVLLSTLTERSGSLWPAAICHGAVNAVAAAPVLVQSLRSINGAHTILGPSLNGMIACLPALVLALVLLLRRRGREA